MGMVIGVCEVVCLRIGLDWVIRVSGSGVGVVWEWGGGGVPEPSPTGLAQTRREEWGSIGVGKSCKRLI